MALCAATKRPLIYAKKVRMSMEWKSIRGLAGKYQVSSTGEVRSITRLVDGTSSFKFLKQWPDHRGYLRVFVVGKYGKQAYYVHRLVIQAFRGSPKPASHKFVAHINGNNQDNRLSNLRWSTKEANEADKKEHGTSPAGQNNPASKLTWSIVRKIRKEKLAGESTAALSRRYKVSEQQIRSIVSNRAWVE